MSYLSALVAAYKDRVLDPSECARELGQMVKDFLTSGKLPDPMCALACLLIVIGAAIHRQDHTINNSGQLTFSSSRKDTPQEWEASLLELAECCDVEPPSMSEKDPKQPSRGIIIDSLLPILLPKLIEIVTKMLEEWLKSRKEEDKPIDVSTLTESEES